MKPLLNFLLAIGMIVSVGGCNLPAWWRLKSSVSFPARHYRELAAEKQQEDRIEQAVLLWQAVKRLDPGDKSVNRKIENLKNLAHKKSRAHFIQGVNAYQDGNFAMARLHFLIALRYSPGHRGCLDYLKSRLHRIEQVSYRIKKGDSLSSIAYRKYKDANLAPVIAYFNDLDPRAPIFPGKVLVLPTLPDEYLIPPSAIQRLLQQARRKIAKGDLETALALLSQVKTDSPYYPKARQLADTAYFRQAADLMARAQYWEALERLKRTSPRFKARAEAISKAREHLKSQAIEDRLKLARNRLEQGAYLEARTIVEEILASSGRNKIAQALMDDINYAIANHLLAEGKDKEAIAVLESIEPNYKDTAVLINDAQLRLNAAAETHYRNGVKYFLNEELELAIQQWQVAIELNPGLDKAQRDIKNARRLLEKLQALETGTPP